jgi:thiamine pyrophosphate-dependent acetolactate synthase large subunit-like protein
VADVPWINTQRHPSKSAKIFHIDVDPLKQQMPVFYLAAVARYRADSFTSITQLTKHIQSSKLSKQLDTQIFSQKWEALAEAHSKRIAIIAEAAKPDAEGSFGTGHLCHVLRKIVPKDSIFAIEAVTNTGFVADNIQATLPGSWINCGGGGLGWSGGGSLGIKLASEHENGAGKGKFVVQIVGDGTFLFSVPSSVYWISQRYKIPILTIVLNNKGIVVKSPTTCLLTPNRLECTPKVTLVGTPRRSRIQSHQRRDKHLVHAGT